MRILHILDHSTPLWLHLPQALYAARATRAGLGKVSPDQHKTNFNGGKNKMEIISYQRSRIYRQACSKRLLEHGDEVAWRRQSGLNDAHCTNIVGSFFPS